jgi:hypothetical protein
MTLPSSWPWPTKEQLLADPISYLDVMYRSLSDEVYAPSWRLTGTMPVGAGLNTVAVLVDIDRLPAFIFVEPDWVTAHRVTAKSITGFTVDFGTVAPGGGGNIDWLVIVTEPGP